MKRPIRTFAVPILGAGLYLILFLFRDADALTVPGNIYPVLHASLEFYPLFVAAAVFYAGWKIFGYNREIKVILVGVLFLGALICGMAHILSDLWLSETGLPAPLRAGAFFGIVAVSWETLALLCYALPLKAHFKSANTKYLFLGAAVCTAGVLVLVPVYVLPRSVLAGMPKAVLLFWGCLLILGNAFVIGILLRRGEENARPKYLDVARGATMEILSTVGFVFAPAAAPLFILSHACNISAHVYYLRSLFLAVVERPYLEMDLQNQQMQRFEKLSSLGEIAAGTVHEVRNPLTAVKGFLQIIRVKTEKQQVLNAKELKLYVELMLNEIERTNEILSEFLLFAKPEKGVFQQCCLGSLIADMMPIIRNQALLKDVEVKASVSSAFMPVLADPQQIKQVLLNLTNNAFEAMEESKNRHLNINCYPVSGGTKVRLVVKDTGPGISEGVMEHIFEPFYSTKEGKKGTGLGLPVVKNIIKNHHGSIEVKSKPGEGTSFIIELPLALQGSIPGLAAKEGAG